jgi:hypothetical protein
MTEHMKCKKCGSMRCDGCEYAACCAANGVLALAAQDWLGLEEPEGRLVLVNTPIPGQRDLYAELVAKDRAGMDIADKGQ